MNDQLARSLFMDYLYDEITDTEKQKLESYLAENPHLRKELDEFRQTRSLLQKMPVQEPDRKLLMLDPNQNSFSQWWQDARTLLPQTLLGKAGFAIAAGLVLLLLVSSVAKLHIETSEAGIAVSFGHSPTVDEISAEHAEMLFNRMQEENAIMMAEYMETINQQNQDQLQQVVNYFQRQRVNDLQLVNQTLNELQQTTDYRLQQTNRFLGQMLQNASYNDGN